ncbi:MAG: patatin, partial [Actinomycetia bacterium]|nr:patatin [Actinomycetes bacterium]
MHTRIVPFRRPRAERNVFVLSGGATRGAAQVGMLVALHERGIRPDRIIGVSVGALNGAAMALDPEGAPAALREIWTGLRGHDIFPGNMLLRGLQLARRRNHLFDNHGLAELANRFAGGRSFADTAVPLEVLACDLDTGEEVMLTEGPLLPALLASSALPGAFPPVLHQGRRLIDGGVINNVPLDHAGTAARTNIYVLNVVPGLDQAVAGSALGVLLRAFAIARHSHSAAEQARHDG